MADLRGKQIRESYRFLLGLSARSSAAVSLGIESSLKFVTDGVGTRTGLRLSNNGIATSSIGIGSLTNANIIQDDGNVTFNFDSTDYMAYSRGTNELRIVINSAQRFFVSNAGKVGINTDNPLYTLSVDGGSGQFDGIATDGNYHLRMKDSLTSTSGYAAIHFKNTTHYYLMTTDENNADGTYNEKRPFYISLASANVLLAGGKVTINHDTGVIDTVAKINIRNNNPYLSLIDTTDNAHNFFLYANSNRFYVLTDRDGDESSDGLYPLELRNSEEAGYIYGKQIVTSDQINVSNLNAQTLDSIDSTQFLRSDVADQKTSGELRFNDNIPATFGNANDMQIYHDGSNSVINNINGPLVIINNSNTYLDQNNNTLFLIRDVNSGYANRFYFDVANGYLGLNSVPSVPLQTDNSVGTAGTINKIKLYSASGADFGFGISPSRLDYVVPAGSVHGFANGGITTLSISNTQVNSSVQVAAPDYRISSDGNNAFLAGQLYLRNNAPIIYMRDTNGRSTALQCTDDSFWIGRTNVNDSTAITAWPLELNIATGNLSIEGNVVSSHFIARTSSSFRGFSGDTATAPAFTWDGDTDTGMFRPGANVIGFTVGGVQQVRLDNSKMDVQVRVSAARFRARGNGTQADPIYGNNDGTAGMYFGTNSIFFGINSTQAVRVDPAGTTMTSNNSLVTQEKGDARYLRLAGGALTGGITFGSRTGSSPTDLSEHINLHGSGYGFSITGNRLNYAVPTNARHDFYIGSNLAARVDIPGTAVGSNESIITAEKGDARYLTTTAGDDRYSKFIVQNATYNSFNFMLSTSYQNTTNRPMMIVIVAMSDNSSNQSISLHVSSDGTSWTNSVVSTATIWNSVVGVAVIPSQWWYRVTGFQTSGKIYRIY